jgi:hypothetical protein
MQCPQTDKSYPYLRKADAENPHRSVGQQMREEWKPRCLLGWVWEASGGLGKATDVGDRHRGERVLVEHASHCKASSGHAKTYYCWHDLTSGLTAFPASIGTLQHAQISATQRVQRRWRGLALPYSRDYVEEERKAAAVRAGIHGRTCQPAWQWRSEHPSPD